jgi:hypothetical protein
VALGRLVARPGWRRGLEATSVQMHDEACVRDDDGDPAASSGMNFQSLQDNRGTIDNIRL